MMTSRTSAEQANILKENALIKRAAKGESQALKELFIKYLPMTLAELKGYNLRHYDDDDLNYLELVAASTPHEVQ